MGGRFVLPFLKGKKMIDLGNLLEMMQEFGMMGIIQAGLIISVVLFLVMRFLDIGRY